MQAIQTGISASEFEDLGRVVSRVTDRDVRVALIGLGVARILRCHAPEPPPPPRDNPRRDEKFRRVHWRPTVNIPGWLTPPRHPLIVLKHCWSSAPVAIPVPDWWGTVCHVTNVSFDVPIWRYHDEATIDRDTIDQLPMTGLKLLRQHHAVVEICRRADRMEYHAPTPGTPRVSDVVWDWCKSEDVDAILFASSEAISGFIYNHAPSPAAIRVLWDAAKANGWPVDHAYTPVIDVESDDPIAEIADDDAWLD